MIRFRMLGTVDLRDGEGRELRDVLRRPKLLALLSYLAAARPHGFHRRDVLLTLFWPELDQPRARNALRQAVHSLRDALGRDTVVSRGEGELGLDPARFSCDVVDFEKHLDAGEPQSALGLYRGDLLVAFHVSDVPEFERWLDLEREHLRRRAASAALALAQEEEARGGSLRAARWVRRALEVSPYDEAVLRRLLRLLDEAGARAEAIQEYDSFVRRLRADLELDPAPETVSLAEAIRARVEARRGASQEFEVSPGASPRGAPAQSTPERIAGAESPGDGPAARTRWRSRIAVLGLVPALAMAMAAYFAVASTRDATSSPRRIMLAVLPFENLTPDSQQDYLSDGLTEEMITQLGRLNAERLGVIARTSAMRYRNTTKRADQIGSELGVDYLLEGSVRRAGGRVLVSARLVRARDQAQVWAERYERDLRDILALQGDIATAIAREIDVKLTPQQQARMTRASPLDPRAHELYLRGRYFWNKRSKDGFTRAIQYFEQAVAHDPGYAQAYAGLADAYALLSAISNALVSRSDGMSRARQAALKALALDDDLAEAHTSLAFVRMHFDWDWRGAETAFNRAIELNPGYATARHWYAYWLIAQGRADEAVREIRRAQQLDPLSLIINTDVSEILLFARRYDEAIEQARKTLEMDPGFALARRMLGVAHMAKGELAPAIRELEAAARISGPRGDILCPMGQAYLAAGRTQEARRTLDAIGGPQSCASILAARGEKDRALASLEKAYRAREGGLILLKVAPEYDPLRSDPRFQDLTRRVLGSS